MRQIGGEFIIHHENGDEQVIPNQFTVVGAQQVLKAAFWAAPTIWYMGLCAHNPADSIPLANIVEPTVGVNGYQRVQLDLNSVNWPTIGQINGESYVESRIVSFTPAGGAFNAQVNRLFLTDGALVIAISAAMEEGLHNIAAILATSYRLYLR